MHTKPKHTHRKCGLAGVLSTRSNSPMMPLSPDLAAQTLMLASLWTVCAVPADIARFVRAHAHFSFVAFALHVVCCQIST